ncbi:ScbA/BarX family gamma-butyrolactone biosynthesis protein [Streptomyces sp. NPDC088725]|uniref:ScbA/BarX family gamma-butyrolactone biosynthesis protein n=1 Tax=Streptomyces sp. NPDC088725 TaxID=3365873 RepID=UPI0037FAF747
MSTPAELAFLQPVPRSLVHRNSVAEVFVTDGLRLNDTLFAVAAQWPRDHALYHPDSNGFSDPLLLAETIRQSLLYVSHSHLGIALGSHFVGYGVTFDITDLEALRVGPAPLTVVLEIDWTWEDKRPNRALARLDVTFTADGRPFATGQVRSLVLDERRYRLLRARPATGAQAPPAANHGLTHVLNTPPDAAIAPDRALTPSPVITPPNPVIASPERVGRLRRRDCVLQEPTPHSPWRLRLDRGHAVLFDHPTDHVPMMAMLEGFRQLGHLMAHEASGAGTGQAYALTGATVDCLAFGELHQPIDLACEERTHDASSGQRRMRITALQQGRPIAAAELTWNPADPAGQDETAARGTAGTSAFR